MQIEIAPETERLVLEQINNGHFRSVDELIAAGLQALRERNAVANYGSASRARNLVELFETSPFKDLDIQFEREQDHGRDVKL